MRKWIAMWLASLLVVAGVSAVLVRAQDSTILSGADLGFRVDRMRADGPVGTFMVRINGKWVEAAFSPKASQLH